MSRTTTRSLVLMSLLTACSGDPKSGGGGEGESGYYVPQSELLESVAQTISAAEGGTIEAEGATLEIPAGALPEDVEITMSVYAPDESLPDFENTWGNVYLLEPHGLEFDVPLALTVPAPDPLPLEEVHETVRRTQGLAVLDEETGEWSPEIGGATPGTATALITHFSTRAAWIRDTRFVVWYCTNAPEDRFDLNELTGSCPDVWHRGDSVQTTGADLATWIAYFGDRADPLNAACRRVDDITYFGYVSCEVDSYDDFDAYPDTQTMAESLATLLEGMGHEERPLSCSEKHNLGAFNLEGIETWTASASNDAGCPADEVINASFFNNFDDAGGCTDTFTDDDTCAISRICETGEEGFVEINTLEGTTDWEGGFDGTFTEEYHIDGALTNTCSWTISTEAGGGDDGGGETEFPADAIQGNDWVSHYEWVDGNGSFSLWMDTAGAGTMEVLARPNFVSPSSGIYSSSVTYSHIGGNQYEIDDADDVYDMICQYCENGSSMGDCADLEVWEVADGISGQDPSSLTKVAFEAHTSFSGEGLVCWPVDGRNQMLPPYSTVTAFYR